MPLLKSCQPCKMQEFAVVVPPIASTFERKATEWINKKNPHVKGHSSLQGRRKHLKLRVHDTLRAFFLKRQGAFLKNKKGYFKKPSKHALSHDHETSSLTFRSSMLYLPKIFLWRCGLKPFLCEGALRHRSTREFYSNNLRAAWPNNARLYTSVEEELKFPQNLSSRLFVFNLFWVGLSGFLATES